MDTLKQVIQDLNADGSESLSTLEEQSRRIKYKGSSITSELDRWTWDDAYTLGYREPRYQMPAVWCYPRYYKHHSREEVHAITWETLTVCECCGNFGESKIVAVIEFDEVLAKRQFMARGQYTNRRQLFECAEIMTEFAMSGGQRQ